MTQTDQTVPSSQSNQTGQTWDPNLYQNNHSFVAHYGRDVVALLDPKPGENILDLGCGTGLLTEEIFQSGASVG